MTISIKVHDVFHALYPMSTYLCEIDEDSVVEPLVLRYWYVVKEITFNSIVFDSYYMTSEYYIFSHKRSKVVLTQDFLNEYGKWIS